MNDVRLGDLVDLSVPGPVDLGVVSEAAQRGDVRVAVLTDEELHWLGRPDRAPQVFLDAPRLGRLAEAQQQVALETAALIMAARGELDWTADPAVAYGPPALIGGIRRGAQAVSIVRTDVRGQGSAVSAVYAAGPDLFLVERVGDDGLHDFVLRSPGLAARALAVEVDPRGRAATEAPPQVAPTVADLHPGPDDIADRCEASSLLYHAHLTSPETISARALTVYSAPDGVWALAGHHPTSATAGHAAWQQLDTTALTALLHGFLRRDP